MACGIGLCVSTKVLKDDEEDMINDDYDDPGTRPRYIERTSPSSFLDSLVIVEVVDTCIVVLVDSSKRVSCGSFVFIQIKFYVSAHTC